MKDPRRARGRVASWLGAAALGALLFPPLVLAQDGVLPAARRLLGPSAGYRAPGEGAAPASPGAWSLPPAEAEGSWSVDDLRRVLTGVPEDRYVDLGRFRGLPGRLPTTGESSAIEAEAGTSRAPVPGEGPLRNAPGAPPASRPERTDRSP